MDHQKSNLKAPGQALGLFLLGGVINSRYESGGEPLMTRTLPIPSRLADAVQGELSLLSESDCKLWGVPAGTIRIYSETCTFAGTDNLARVTPQRRHTNGFGGRVRFYAVTPTELKILQDHYGKSNVKRRASQTAAAITLAAKSAKTLQAEAGVKANKLTCITKLIDNLPMVDEDF